MTVDPDAWRQVDEGWGRRAADFASLSEPANVREYVTMHHRLGVDAGELGSGHHATALYEVTLADGVEPGATIGRASVLWKPAGPGTGEAEPQEARTDLVAADPGATPSTSLRLATAAADLAQVLKGTAPFAGRGVTLDDLDERLDALGGTPGAADLAELVALAREAG